MIDATPGQPRACRDVCAVVVTYHPDSGLPSRLSRIAPQVGATVIVDNGSSGASLHMLRELSPAPAPTILFNGENLGVAKALNIGVRQALDDGFTWALLLDQDTLVDPDMVERLVAARESCPEHRVAVVGSRFRDTSGRSIDPCRLEARGEQWEQVESVITSGSLLSLSAYPAIGPFREDFFIDRVDTEYCYRARAAGHWVIQTLQPLMSHTVGASSSHRLFWATNWTTHHSADRRYYIARNDTVLLREYRNSSHGPWQLKSLVRCIRLCKRIACFERDKISKILAVGQGWWDGMRGRMGPRALRSTRHRTL